MKYFASISFFIIILASCTNRDGEIIDLINLVKQQNDELKAQITALKKTTDSALVAVLKVNSIQTATDKKIDLIQTDLKTILTQISSLTTQMTAANTDLASLKIKIDALQAKCAELVAHIALLNSANNGYLSDIDGNVYKTVKIGDQDWMAENLNVSNWLGGQKNTNWIQSKYGKLYQPRAFYFLETNGILNSTNICPKGWHVPNSADWQKLIKNLGGNLKTIGAKLKINEISGWSSSVPNDVGFNAYPSGFADSYLKTSQENTLTSFWGIDSIPSGFSTYTLKENSDELFVNQVPSYFYLSCRCVKD